eukprot:2056634-Rhodomonas_salina.1
MSGAEKVTDLAPESGVPEGVLGDADGLFQVLNAESNAVIAEADEPLVCLAVCCTLNARDVGLAVNHFSAHAGNQ